MISGIMYKNLLEVNKLTCQKGLLKKMGKISKGSALNTKLLHGKT